MKVIEIQEEVAIEQDGKKIILEKGDRIRVLYEAQSDINGWTFEGGSYLDDPYLYKEVNEDSIEIYKVTKNLYIIQMTRNGKESSDKVKSSNEVISYASKNGFSNLTLDLLSKLQIANS